MDIGHLKIDLPADGRALRPHDAPALAQVRISFPSATSYSIEFNDCNNGCIGMHWAMARGMTVSQAPVSAVSSTSIQPSSSVEAAVEESIALVSAE